MKISFYWLSEFLPLENITPEEVAEILTFSGLEVSSITKPKNKIKNVITSKIIEIKKHPNADKLTICKVSDGQRIYSVVCGANNITAGDTVPLALPGAVLSDGTTIKETIIRNEKSEGMLCSAKELGNDDGINGIMILDNNTQIGKDITELFPVQDCILEVEIPANRSDCSGHIGIAREISAKLKLPLKLPPTHLSEKISEMTNFRIDILEPSLCTRYMAAVMDSVKISTSPVEIKLKLIHCGLRPINNLVDITNYVMLETGHPTHLFDYEKIKGNQIFVRRANELEKITALDSKTYNLNEKIPVIADGSEPVAIAGIIGGLYSGVNEQTKIILLETAIFNPETVKNAQNQLQLFTEAGYRFTKGTSWDICSYAHSRAIELLTRIGNARLIARYDVFNEKYQSKKITLRKETVQRILSVDYSLKDITETFSRLDIKVLNQSEDKKTMMVEIPSYRNDLNEEIDLIEEIARIQGYETIPEKTRINIYHGTESAESNFWKFTKKVRDHLISKGIQEVINFSFISSDDLIKTPELQKKRKPVEITNPVSAEFSHLRNCNLFGMLKNLITNYRTQNIKSLKIFETGKIFYIKNDSKVEEETLDILLTGNFIEPSWNNRGINIDFYFVKGLIEGIFSDTGIKNYEFKISLDEKDDIFVHGKSADIFLENEIYAGKFGLIWPHLHEEFNADVYYVWVYVNELYNSAKSDIKIKNVPKFPPSIRDICLVAPEEITYSTIEEKIISQKGNLILDLYLFDLYKGEKIEKGKKSYTIKLTFYHPEKTLTDNEVNDCLERILKNLETLNIHLRK